MGRHSARRKAGTRRHRTATNSMAVLLITCLTAIAVYAGIGSLATAKNNEIPPPTISAAVTPAADPIGAETHVNAPAAEVVAAPAAESTLRRCPATGCTASTCHAETGEPTPHM